MDRFAPIFRLFLADERGVTSIEYGMIAGFISIVIVTASTQIGGLVRGMFQSAAAGFQ